jgi:hypothetical protein
LIRRREVLAAGLGLLLAPATAWARGSRSVAVARAPDAERALAGSPFVYVSPLRSDGSESTCHGEVWYGWLDGAVVITTGSSTWKARSLARGLDRARVWVGDYGRWKRVLGRNDAFRAGPSFVARASTAPDPRLLDRLLEVYDAKYPDEIGRWRDRMRQDHAEGSRVLIRYRPESAGSRRT